MTKEQALEFEQEFLNGDYVDHKQFSKFKGKGEFWYFNLAKKYNLKYIKNNKLPKQINKQNGTQSYQREYQREYRTKNKEKLANYKKEWKHKNRFKVKIDKRLYKMKLKFRERMGE